MPPLTIQQAFDLALQHHQAGRLQDAEQLYRQILHVQPKHPDVLHNLALILHQNGFQAEAMELIRKTISLGINPSNAHYTLGNFLFAQGRASEAIPCFQRAIALKPDHSDAHFNLGISFQVLGHLDEAIECFHRALDCKPDFINAYLNAGNALLSKGRFSEAIQYYQKALQLNPNLQEAHSNMGAVFQAIGDLDQAIACFERALALKPDYVDALNNMGFVLHAQGRLNEAIACCQKAALLDPKRVEPQSNLLYMHLYHPDHDSHFFYKKHREWNLNFAEPLKQFILPHHNDNSPDRKLRIGYVSPDFRSHSVGRFLLPLIENHDRKNFELFAYSQVSAPDALTKRFRSSMDAWRSTMGLSDEQVASQIRNDKIDILVDLAMHTAGNRLLVFARKPAPVQATWLAYCGSTGLETVDYRLSDPFFDPAGEDLSCYSEQTLRLPETYWCYTAIKLEEKQCPPPALEKGFITFGCFNNFCKISDATAECWAQILNSVPQSRLLLHAEDGGHREKFLLKMKEKGIVPERIEFVGKVLTKEYFAHYYRTDIALDPFPYGGGTTTCDALWMGAPVVSLLGKTAVGRGGFSILSNIGLPELVGSNVEEYVQIAVRLAGDLPRLTELHATLRQRMQASPLMDAPRFARNMEAVYRNIWQKWCETQRILASTNQATFLTDQK